MKRFFFWVQKNKLAAFLLVLVGWLLFKQSGWFYDFRLQTAQKMVPAPQPLLTEVSDFGGAEIGMMPPTNYAPVPEVEDRLVIKESSLSLLVRDVTEALKNIQQQAENLRGYLVSSRVSHPEETEAATGTITVQVPQEKLEDFLSVCRNLSVRVVSETVSGRDVTDEYVDIQARLETLGQTKEKFTAILNQAEEIKDILEVQRQIINLQDQIDRLLGRAQFLEASARVSRVTVYLSSDELSLPYAPTEAWRPRVIFKQAVRSLVRLVRQLGTGLIWLGVYAIIWLPALVVYRLYRRRHKK